MATERSGETGRRGPARTSRVLRAGAWSALAVLLWGPASRAAAAPTGPVVTEVRVVAGEGDLVVEILGSGLVGSQAVETPGDPFVLALEMPDAVFAFPLVTRDVQEGPLRRLSAAMVERDGQRTGRVALVFDQPVQYRIDQDAGRLAVHVTVPVRTRVLLRGSLSRAGDPHPVEMPAPLPPTRPSRPFLAAARTAPRSALSPGAPTPGPPSQPPAKALGPGGGGTPDAPAVSSPSAGSATAAAPDTAASGPRPLPAAGQPPARAIRVLRLSEVGTAGETQIRVHTDGPLARYGAFTLPSPPRLVVDFEGAAFAMRESSLSVDSPLVERARASRFQATPIEVVRVVLDLKHPVPYWIEPLPDGVIVHVGSSESRR